MEKGLIKKRACIDSPTEDSTAAFSTAEEQDAPEVDLKKKSEIHLI